MTRIGVILGTAAYMSPEQARGMAADKRSDIWAFGCVLYEMLTGEQLFWGKTITDVLAAVVKSEPDWSRVPLRTRRLLRSCLEKEPRRRLQAISDAWLMMRRPRSPNQRTGATGWHGCSQAPLLLLRRQRSGRCGDNRSSKNARCNFI